MLHQNKAHAGVLRQRLQEFLECFEPTRRRSNTHNGDWHRAVL